MGLKKIVITMQKPASLTYTALGGLRFYDADGIIINSGIVVTTGKTIGETTNFKITATSSFSSNVNHDLPHLVNTNLSQTGISNSSATTAPHYWLTDGAGQQIITVEFKNIVNSISKIEFVPRPDSALKERGLDSNFTIEGLSENNESIYTYSVTPISTNDTVQTISTPKFMVINKTLLKSNNKVYSFESIEQTYDIKMTSNTAPSPYVASASSVYNTSYYSAWKAFNGTNSANTDCWITANGVFKGWIQLDFGKKTPVTKVFITSRVGSGGEKVAPKDFNIEGSNDNVNFDVIQSFKGVTDWERNITKEFNIRKREYRYYRLNILANNGDGSYSGVGKLEFYYKDSDLIKLPQSNKENFVNYGFSSPSQFNNILTDKNYILQKTVSENTEGLLATTLNRKPLSIGIS